jgi:hypothetical protein
MSVNKEKPHLYVDSRYVQVVDPAGGWNAVLETFNRGFLTVLRANRKAHAVLLMDFDGDPEHRLGFCFNKIPSEVKDRVFVLGPQNTPETLRKSLARGGFEYIRAALATECDTGQLAVWSHEELIHNEAERERLAATVKPFLFR